MTVFIMILTLKRLFHPDDLEKIEAEMKKIVKEGLSLEKFELPADEAVKLMEEKGEPYKVELINEHAGKGENISFYKQGEFTGALRRTPPYGC